MAIRFSTISAPLDTPAIRPRVAQALRHAEAMGLFAPPKKARSLDLEAFTSALAPVAKRDIARRPLATLAEGRRLAPAELAGAIDAINHALLESPVPADEWPRVTS